jgi:hypothetical protein
MLAHALLSCLSVGGSALEEGNNDPAVLEHTGIQWVLPFQEALQTAREGSRILMIKAVAGGTDRLGGW